MILAAAFVIAGTASYYSAAGYDPNAHTCAMYSVPKGTTVHIVNDDNGKTSYCRVTDYGPDAGKFPGRVIDVMPIVAKDLGFYPDIGVAHVRVYRSVPIYNRKRRNVGVFCLREVSHVRQNQSVLGRQAVQHSRPRHVPQWSCRGIRAHAHARSRVRRPRSVRRVHGARGASHHA